MWLPLAHPLLGTWPETQACTLTGNWTRDLLLRRPTLNPLNYTIQNNKILYFFLFTIKSLLHILNSDNVEEKQPFVHKHRCCVLIKLHLQKQAFGSCTTDCQTPAPETKSLTTIQYYLFSLHESFFSHLALWTWPHCPLGPITRISYNCIIMLVEIHVLFKVRMTF